MLIFFCFSHLVLNQSYNKIKVEEKEVKTLKKIAVLGGDEREKILIKTLVKNNFKISVLSKQRLIKHNNITYSDKIKKVISDAEVVIAPLSGTDDNNYLKNVFTDQKVKIDEKTISFFSANTLFIIGSVSEKIKKMLQKREVILVETADLDQLAILNAIPTAEGALNIAITETPFTIHGSQILVLGLGRVGLTLGWRLKALGAKVYAATRNKKAKARGQEQGLIMIDYKKLHSYLPEMDIVFNTVPAMILTPDYIKLLKQKALIVDLASYPGGTDFEACAEQNIKALLAPGLPGKVAPESAGKILAEIIPEIIEQPLKYT